MTAKKETAGCSPAVTQKMGIGNLDTCIDYTQKSAAFNPQRIDTAVLLSRVDLVALVEQAGTRLVQKAGEYRGRCPLHGGQNPTAFQVYPSENGGWLWRCWSGCDTGGDALAFVQQRENITSFLEAVRWLADWARIPYDEIGFSHQEQQAAEEHQKRATLLAAAARFAARQLWSLVGEQALAYVRGRGFRSDVIRLAGFGFLDGSTRLQQHLAGHDADLKLAYQLGLVRKDGRDFTANANGNTAAPKGWLIYAHRAYPHARLQECDHCAAQTWHTPAGCLRHSETYDHLQQVSYLSARALDPASVADKARNLPGQRQIYTAEVPGVREIILCEGQADAESYRQLGFSAWGLCGLGALSDENIKELQRRPVVYVALDGDPAGQEKQMHLAESLGPLAMLVPAIENGKVKDANAWLQAGANPDAVTEHLQRAKPWIEHLLGQVAKASPYELKALTRQIATALQELPEELRPRYIRKAQQRLGMTQRQLQQLTNGVSKNGSTQVHTLAQIKDGVLTFLGEPLGNFNIQIAKELILDDGLNPPQVRYTVHGKLAAGEALVPVDIEADEFASLNWISRHWGARPILYLPYGRRHLFVRAVQEISLSEMERERVYTHTGWTEIDGERSFLTTSGRITAKGLDNGMGVELDHHLRHYALPAPPAGAERNLAVKASLDFLRLGPLTVTAPIWAAVMAAPLTEVLPLYTLLWVYGSTQSGKSTLVHLALAHFGAGFIEGRQYRAPADWMSTVTHLEESMFAAKDVPLVIDDFAPQFHSAADSRYMHKTAHRVVRSVGNRAARGRSKKYQDQTLIPRGLVISTAELPLVGESTVGRMLYVPIQRGDILPDNGERSRPALDQAQQQAQQGIYGLAMSAYIQWLAANWDAAAQKIKEIREESLRYIRSQENVQNRLPDYFATLDAAAQLALGAFYEMGILAADDAAILADEIGQAILEVVTSQAEKIAAESPVRKFFEALNSLLERRKVYLAPRTNSYIFSPEPQSELVGWHDPGENCLYLDDGACLEQVRHYWAALGENFDSTTDALRRQINQIPGLLAEKGEGRNLLVSKWIAGKTRRALAVDRSVVAKLYGVTLQNETTATAIKEQDE